MNQILMPLLAVAADEALRQAVRSAAQRIQKGIVSDRSDSTEGNLIAVLAKFLPFSDGHLSLGEITTAFIAAHASDYQRPIVNRWIASRLRRLGIALYKRNGVFVLLPGQEERIAALCKRFGVSESEIDCPSTETM